VAKRSPDSTIANATKASTAARRNLSARVNFALLLVSTGGVAGDLPEQMLWGDISGRKQVEFASSLSSKKRGRNDKTGN